MTREEGFYWIRQCGEDEWEIAHWFMGYWYVTGSEIEKDEIVEIDERPIVRP